MLTHVRSCKDKATPCGSKAGRPSYPCQSEGKEGECWEYGVVKLFRESFIGMSMVSFIYPQVPCTLNFQRSS